MTVTALMLFIGVFSNACGNNQAAQGKNNSFTISVVTKDMYLDMVVKKFQELHPSINVEVKEYTSNPLPPASGKGIIIRTEDPIDIEKYVMAMNTQLMSGQGSDIILLNNLPYETYADKNLLLNLGQMMQSDQSFNSSKYYQNILEALEYKGNLYGLPVSFSIDIMAADKTLLENSQVKIDDNTWSWNDFVKMAEKVINDNKTRGTQELYALAGMDEKRLITSLVRENYGKLVDSEKKTANFTGKEFLDLLNLSKYLIDHKLINTDTTQTNMMDLASRGKLVFNLIPLRGFMDLQATKTIFTGEVQLLKPPGNEGNLFFTTDSMYGISNNSPHQELAWEFLKLLVSDEMMSQGTLFGMPINKSVVPQIAQNTIQSLQKGGRMIMKGANNSQAQSITLQPPTQEEINFVESLLNKANIYNGTDQKIISIMQEETTAFFTGQKTAEVTARLIQDRVSTYLNE
ncbi:MAG: ABC transporter substrate-binding protein [Peptococcaceae bacterium BICA1-8]|nr:MAG: ABC transporter substrate-binding protein [Peptococcaceae bacterium BICA1-8]